MIVDTSIVGIVAAVDTQNHQTAYIQVMPVDGDADTAVIEVKRAFDAGLRTPSSSFALTKTLTLDGSAIIEVDVTDTAFLHFDVTTAQASRNVDIGVSLKRPMSGFVHQIKIDTSVSGVRGSFHANGAESVSMLAVPSVAVTTAQLEIKQALERSNTPVSFAPAASMTLDGSSIIDQRLDAGEWILADVTKGQPGQLIDLYIYQRDKVPDDTSLRGWADYNDDATSTTPISLSAGVWTAITNDGLGSFTNTDHMPRGVSQLMDTSTGEIDPRELRIGDDMFIRNDFEINPNSNNAEIRFRYKLGTGAGVYYLEGPVDNIVTAGTYYKHITLDYIYVGDENTRGNKIEIQVKCSKSADLTNHGSVIRVSRGKT